MTTKIVKEPYKLGITTTLFLISSVKSTSRIALELQAAIIHRLYIITTKLPSHGLYLFILVPFFVEFWKLRIENYPNDFVDLQYLKLTGIPLIESADIFDRIVVLFKVLYYHLELSPENDFFDNFSNNYL